MSKEKEAELIAPVLPSLQELQSNILKLEEDNKSLLIENAEKENMILTLSDLLTKAEAPVLEKVQAELKVLGLNAVTHRGEIKVCKLGSVNQKPIVEMNDEELDVLADAELLVAYEA